MFFMLSISTYSQVNWSTPRKNSGARDTIYIDSADQVIFLTRGVCKSFKISVFERVAVITDSSSHQLSATNGSQKIPFLKFTGSVSYDFYYNQRVDTPFAKRGFQQHTETVNLQGVLQGKYPFTIRFTSRQTNSPFFKNFFDPGLRFENSMFVGSQKRKYLDKLGNGSIIADRIKELDKRLNDLHLKEQTLSQQITSQGWRQKIVKEREAFLRQKNSHDLSPLMPYNSSTLRSLRISADTASSARQGLSWIDSLNLDSITGIPETPTEHWLRSQDSARKLVQLQQISLKQYRDSIETSFSLQKQSLAKAFKSNRELKDYVKKYGDINVSEKFLLNLKSAGIGKTEVTYTDLTIKNISITGIQAEYEPRLYYAIAGGTIDYRFREYFLTRNGKSKPQQFYIARFGNSYSNRKGVIASVFTGVKNSFVTGTSQGQNKFSGYSVEGFYNWGAEGSVSLEIAKTTPAILLTSQKKTGLLDFDSPDNMGLVGKLHYRLAASATLIDAYYRKTGYSFQSINLLSSNVTQTAWNIKLQQNLFKRTLTVAASLRQNDFATPYFTPNFNTNAVFKSITIGYRRQNCPFFSVGYYPGTQLVKADSAIIENVYYLINATAGYLRDFDNFTSYSVFNYNSFINKSTDTGFVLSRGYSFFFNQDIITADVCYKGAVTYTKQSDINYYTLEAGAEFQLKKLLSVAASIKYNKLINGRSAMAASGMVKIDVPKICLIQCSYDRMFIPSINRTLESADVGRFTLIKYF
jgi:hypothetical protein